MSNQIKTVIFDSSVWVSSLFPDDVNHSKAIQIVKHYNNSRYTILVPNIVYYEVIMVSIRKGRRDLAEDFIKLDFDMITLQDKEFLDFAFRYQNHLTTRTQDSLIIMHCLKYNVEYFETFDNKQRDTYNLIRSL